MIDGQVVLLTHLQNPISEPAVVVGQPLRSVIVALLMPVDGGTGQGQVEQITGKRLSSGIVCSTQAAVVSLRPSNDVLYVGLASAMSRVDAQELLRALLAFDCLLNEHARLPRISPDGIVSDAP